MTEVLPVNTESRSKAAVDAEFQVIMIDGRRKGNPDVVHRYLDQFSTEERLDILIRNLLVTAPESAQIAVADLSAGPDPLTNSPFRRVVLGSTLDPGVSGFIHWLKEQENARQ